jgi:hypothetical protein
MVGAVMVGKGRAPGIEPGAVGGLGELEIVSEGLLGHLQCRSSVGVAEDDLFEVFVHFKDRVFLVVVLANVFGGVVHGVVWLVVVVALLASMWETYPAPGKVQ